jgi:hypothetical protein
MKINEIITEATKGTFADQLAPIQQQRMSDYERDFKANNQTPAQRYAAKQADIMKKVTQVEPDEHGLTAPGLSKRKANLDSAIKKFGIIKNACNTAEERGLNVSDIRGSMSNFYTQFYSDRGHETDYLDLNQYLDSQIARLKTIFARARMLKKDGSIRG